MADRKRFSYRCIIATYRRKCYVLAVADAGKIRSLMDGRCSSLDPIRHNVHFRDMEVSKGLYETWKRHIKVCPQAYPMPRIVCGTGRACMVDKRGNFLNVKERRFMEA